MPKKLIIFIICLVALIAFGHSELAEYITFENLKQNRESLRLFVHEHYVSSVLGFIAAFVSTAFFIPGAMVMSIAAGFLFGIVRGTIYINIGSTLGAALAFLSARHLLGNRLQKRFQSQFERFHEAIEKHSYSYLLALRIIPMLPFFLVNFLAGTANIPLKTFLWTTSVGALPGSLILTFAGRQLGNIERIEDIFSFWLFLASLWLVLFLLSPVFYDYIIKRRKKQG